MFSFFKFTLTALIVINAISVFAQTSPSASSSELLIQLGNQKRDTNRVKTLLSLQQYYIQKRGYQKENLDSAVTYGLQSKLLADSLRRTDLKDGSLMLTGEVYLKFLDYDKGKACFLEAANDYRAAGKPVLESRALFVFTAKAMFYKSMPAEILDYAKRSLVIATQLGDSKGMMNGHLIVGTLFDRFSKPDSAGAHLLKAQALSKLVSPEDVFKLNIALANFYRTQGDLVKALTNEQAALQNLKDRKVPETSKQYAFTNIEIAKIYGSYDKKQSVRYLNDAMKYALVNKSEGGMEQYYEALQIQVYMMNEIGDPQKTLIWAKACIHKYPPVSDLEKGRVAGALAICYKYLHQYKDAEKYYLLAVALYKNDIFLLPESKLALSHFYAETKQYLKLDSVQLNRPVKRGSMTFTQRVEEEFVQYQLDSAKGNYKSALDHFRRYKGLDDTLYNARKSSQMYNLNIKYQTREKEQAIRLLKSETQSQRSDLKRNRLERNITFIGLAVIFLIGGLGAYSYLQKQRSNRLLIMQKQEIDKKNRSLENLTNSQRKLLIEKEWLLKEIHHRVKNNLQITMSLLSVQTHTTTSKVAREALQNGQRRLHSMSLIHQKLYQSDSLAYVEMSSYIKDLVAYLKDSFDQTNHINFMIDAEQLELDVAQAVPLGLILNEAITNAIKHAFPGKNRGEIRIKLTSDGLGFHHLIISDNGVGLDCDPTKVQESLGMELFRVLTKQIDGELCINGESGMTIAIRFTPVDLFVDKGDIANLQVS